jgi:hypothetical protein
MVAVGTRVRYTLSEPAAVTFKVEMLRGGRLVKSRCRKPTRKTRAKPRCDLLLTGSFTNRGDAGRNNLGFTGRLGGRALRPGNYRLVATARDLAGNASSPRRTRFTVVIGVRR